MVRLPRELRFLKHSWIYFVGLFTSVTLILLFFWLNPWTENPPFP